MAEANKEIVQRRFDLSTDRVILFGDGGSGKSASLATLFIECPEDRRVIYLMTEPNAARGLEWGLKHHNIQVEPGQLIFAYPKRTESGFKNLSRALKTFSEESKSAALAGKDTTTMGKQNYGYLQKIMDSLDSFVGEDYATGEQVKVGSVDSLDSSDILVTDGITPIAHELWNTMHGDKIAISKFDFNPVQGAMLRIFMNYASLKCHVILLAHERVEVDDKGNTLSTKVDFGVGNKMDSKLKGCVTDIIYCYKLGSKHLWAGSKSKVDTVARVIPKEDALVPDFSLYNFFGNVGTYIEK